ncbi:TPA: hypothetical protein ACH3X3_011767 [Trebouxia sp. C0006]
MLGRPTGPFASWCVGWTKCLGQIALVAADTFSCAQLFLSFLYLVSMETTGTGYYPSNALVSCKARFSPSWHLPLSVVGRLSELGALFNLVGTIVFVAVLLLVTKKQQHFSWVLTSYQSNLSSGITSNTYICLLGLLPAVWSLLGYDSTAHMIEETKEADAVAGWPMPYAVALSGISGLPFLIALTICIQDVDQLTDPDNGFDGINIVAQLLWQAYKTRFDTGVASLSLFAIPLGANFISALYAITSASRMLFGFSRDQAVPFSSTWQKVDESSGVPCCAVWGVTGA